VIFWSSAKVHWKQMFVYSVADEQHPTLFFCLQFLFDLTTTRTNVFTIFVFHNTVILFTCAVPVLHPTYATWHDLFCNANCAPKVKMLARAPMMPIWEGGHVYDVQRVWCVGIDIIFLSIWSFQTLIAQSNFVFCYIYPLVYDFIILTAWLH